MYHVNKYSVCDASAARTIGAYSAILVHGEM